MSVISVVICTFNRSAYLPRLLESLRMQKIDSRSFEILVVDNNSTDETPGVVRGLQETMRNLRYVYEPEQGLSLARNRGLREARSPLVAYVDDDAYAEPQWLASIVEAFREGERIVCVGGPVKLDWQGERPQWVPEKYESLYTSVDHGSEERPLTPKDYLVGANMAFRRGWLLDRGGFPSDLGRKGACLLSGEEAVVYQSVFASGGEAFYHPGARVMHRVTTERKNRKWFMRRLFWDGATQPILDGGTGQPAKTYWRNAYHDARRCARFSLEAAWAVLRIDRKGLIDALCRLDQRAGRLYMHMQLAVGRVR